MSRLEFDIGDEVVTLIDGVHTLCRIQSCDPPKFFADNTYTICTSEPPYQMFTVPETALLSLQGWLTNRLAAQKTNLQATMPPSMRKEPPMPPCPFKYPVGSRVFPRNAETQEPLRITSVTLRTDGSHPQAVQLRYTVHKISLKMEPSFIVCENEICNEEEWTAAHPPKPRFIPGQAVHIIGRGTRVYHIHRQDTYDATRYILFPYDSYDDKWRCVSQADLAPANVTL